MSTETKYDVFISSKSEDYHLAEKVYDFLTAKGLSVFLASKILEKLGESEYASKIDELLDNSTHLIVVSSKLDYINSKWVKYEWSLFSSDLKSGYRQGNLLTILSNSIELKNLPASLRHRQSFRLDAFQENIMGYLVPEDGERAKRLQQIREQLENLETRKYQIEQEISEQEKALSGLRNEKRIVEDKIFDLRCERDIIYGGNQHISRTPLSKQSNVKKQEESASKRLLKNTTFEVNGVSFDMIKVEGGTFTMGATSEQGDDAHGNERPAHQVTLSDYIIGETEVTQELWQAVMGSNPSRFKGDNLPVERVSWNDCQEFIKKLNSLTGLQFRLPTEAEWEYAARGGNKSKGYKYSGSNDFGSVAWYWDNESSKTHNVATKAPNELGLYDMSGNVWEWCSDWYGDYSSDSQTNPKGPSSGFGRVFRGGSWGSNARCCRVSNRFSNIPDYRYYSLGLRLAL